MHQAAVRLGPQHAVDLPLMDWSTEQRVDESAGGGEPNTSHGVSRCYKQSYIIMCIPKKVSYAEGVVSGPCVSS